MGDVGALGLGGCLGALAIVTKNEFVSGIIHAVFVADEGEDFLLVGPVIAGGDHIDAHGEEFFRDGAGQAEAARRILAIVDDEIQFQALAQARQFKAASPREWWSPILPSRASRLTIRT